MKVYPFDVPEPWHPSIWWLFGFGLTVDQMNMIVTHLSDDLGLRLVEDFREESFSWVVDWADEDEDRRRLSVGDEVDILVAENGAVRVVDGAPPPGVTLDRATGRFRGVVTHPGLFDATVRIGPAGKYDALGSPGGPEHPGMWIPVEQPRQEGASRLGDFPITVGDLDDRSKDELLAELLAWRDGAANRAADLKLIRLCDEMRCP